MEHDGEAVHHPVKHRPHGFRREIARGEAGAAGGQDHIDVRIGGPGLDLGLDGRDVIRNDHSGEQPMTGRLKPPRQQTPGCVVGGRSGVRYGQDRDIQGKKGKPVIDPGSLAGRVLHTGAHAGFLLPWPPSTEGAALSSIQAVQPTARTSGGHCPPPGRDARGAGNLRQPRHPGPIIGRYG